MFQNIADLAVQQATNTLGMPAVFQYKVDALQINVNAIYQKNREIYDTESGVVTGYSESATLRVADLPTLPKQNDSITINSANYDVIDVEHDGIAFCVLYLRLK